MPSGMTQLWRQSAAGLRLLLALSLVTGLLYPLAVLAAGRAVPGRADGSLLRVDGRVVGSALVGQSFDGETWFHPRPSAAGDGYDPLATGASNLGPENPELLAEVQQRRADVAAAERVPPEQVPADALTASGSGLDPDISPAYARLQVPRVAAARGLNREQVATLVEQEVQGRTWSVLGQPRVNVLKLNLALDALGGR